MPFYDLKCKKCGEEYQIRSTMAEMKENIKKARCTECRSKSKQQLITGVNFAFSNPVGTDRWNNSHDYRFKHNIPKAAAERENAQKKSHVGPTPYNNIDDISGGKHFGPVK